MPLKLFRRSINKSSFLFKSSILLICFSCLTAITFKVPFSSTNYDLRYPANFGNRTFIPKDNPTTVEGVTLGRKLFYETQLSADNSISCGSCHIQSKAFTDGRTKSIGINNQLTSRNSMSLANLL